MRLDRFLKRSWGQAGSCRGGFNEGTNGIRCEEGSANSMRSARFSNVLQHADAPVCKRGTACKRGTLRFLRDLGGGGVETCVPTDLVDERQQLRFTGPGVSAHEHVDLPSRPDERTNDNTNTHRPNSATAVDGKDDMIRHAE